MRALARDSFSQLTNIFSNFFDEFNIVLRTSDSSSYQKKKARANQWDLLITTPESAALFTTYDDMHSVLASVDVVVIDEWHVLLHQKRGILLELFLSWLSQFNARFKRWALAATISSSETAAAVLSPNEPVEIIKDDFQNTYLQNLTIFKDLLSFLGETQWTP